MICPNCKNESNGAKWCPECGLQLEIDETHNGIFEKSSKGDTQKLRPVSAQHNDAQTSYGKPYERKNKNASKNTGVSDKSFKILLISVGAAAVSLIFVVVLIILGVIGPKNNKVSEPTNKIVLENEDTDALFETAMENFELGDYEEAETLFEAVLEADADNDEAKLIYDIVYNYNRAIKKNQVKKYEEAREFFDNIPIDYIDYAIKMDVEKLDNEISSFETAYASFAEVQRCMEDADYEEALKAIEIIDKNYLTDADCVTLDEYSAEIQQYLKNKENEEVSDDMTKKKAEIIITEYCEDLVMAINSRDFSIVEKHISGQLYNDQKKLVQTCIDNGITESFDALIIKDVHKISDTKWKVSVAEGETLYHSDGTKESKTFDWTYTIEFIDSEFYLTKIE